MLFVDRRKRVAIIAGFLNVVHAGKENPVRRSRWSASSRSASLILPSDSSSDMHRLRREHLRRSLIRCSSGEKLRLFFSPGLEAESSLDASSKRLVASSIRRTCGILLPEVIRCWPSSSRELHPSTSATARSAVLGGKKGGKELNGKGVNVQWN
nr:hypothetical protein Iba_chr15eCG6550 [Ipomoea batatas]